jgi:hypothetical protein
MYWVLWHTSFLCFAFCRTNLKWSQWWFNQWPVKVHWWQYFFFLLAVLEWHQWWEAVPIDEGCRVSESATTVWCVTVHLRCFHTEGVTITAQPRAQIPGKSIRRLSGYSVCSMHVTSSLLGRGASFLCVQGRVHQIEKHMQRWGHQGSSELCGVCR